MLKVLVVGIVALAAMPCAPYEALAVWTQPRFAIGGFGSGGQPGGLKLLNDAGIDLIVPSDHPDPTSSRAIVARLDSLRAAHPQTFDMQDIVYEETGLPATLFKNLDPLTNRSAIISELSSTSGLNTASVAGWYIWDEPPIYYPPNNNPPSSQIYDAIHEMTKVVRDTTNKLATLAMLQISGAAYPWYQPGCDPDTLQAYLCYLDQYLSRFNSDPYPAPLLMFDSYPFEAPGSYWTWYFVNLAALRDKALQYSRANYSVPFWSVIQASPRTVPPQPTPTLNQIRWQSYVSLAYGAKGIFYWTLKPQPGPGYGPSFLKVDGTANTPMYDSLAALNSELRMLGPTLMQLDPVATYHVAANGFKLPAEENTLSNPDRTYKIVTSVTGTNNQGMVGYFKSRVGGVDYLLVVNKDTTLAQPFTVTLGSAADTVYRVNRITGGLDLITPTGSPTFGTGTIRPGGGELFRIIDKTYEYITNVNRVVTVGDTTWYAHQKGVAMAVRSTGRRIHYKDGTVYTPAVDVAVSRDHVFIAQDNGTNGNLIRTNRDMSAPTGFYVGLTRVVGATTERAESTIVLVERLSATTSRVRAMNAAGSTLTTLDFNDAGAPSTPWVAYDVQYQQGLGSFVVAHGRYYSRYLSKSPWTLLQRRNYRTPVPTNVRLTALGTGTTQLLFAGRNEGTIGGVEKMDYLLNRPSVNGWWPAAQTEPSVKDVYASGNHVLFCSTSPTGDFFVRLRALDLWALGYRATTLPTAVSLTPDSVALMANGAGVARSSQTGLSGTFRMIMPSRPRADSLSMAPPARLALSVYPSPVTTRVGIVRFDLPSPGRVQIAAYDVQGRRLGLLLDAELPAGTHEARWTPPRKSVVFLRLEHGGERITQQVAVLK